MSKPISVEEYIKTNMSVAIIDNARNYLKKYEKPGYATKIKEHEEYILDIMNEVYDAVVKKDGIKIEHKDGKVTRNGKKIEGLKRTSMEQYLEGKRKAGQINTTMEKEERD